MPPATAPCCMQFVTLHNLQNALHDLARVNIRVRIRIRVGDGVRVRVGLGLGLGQTFTNSACAISKLCSIFANCADWQITCNNHIEIVARTFACELLCSCHQLLICGLDSCFS